MSEVTLLAKQGRTTAKRLFTMSIDSLNKAISKKQPVATIQKLFNTADQRWQTVQEKHAVYLTHYLADDEEEPPDVEVQWLS